MSPRLSLETVLNRRDYSAQTISVVKQKLAVATDLLAAVTELAVDCDNETRLLATELLGECGDTATAPVLWKLLGDHSEAVGTMAAYSLTRLQRRVPVSLNFDGLSDPRASVRRLAAETLGRLGHPSAEPALRRAAEDSDALVRLRAADALHQCGTPVSVPALLALLKDPNRSVRRSAATALGKIGDLRAVDPLVAALEDPDANVRVHAIGALAVLAETSRSDHAAIIAAIRAKLHDDDYVLLAAAREMGIGDNDRVADSLARAVLSDDSARSRRAAEFICRFNVTAALPLLARHSRHPNIEVRHRILDLIHRIGSADCVPALHTALNDSDPYIVLTAIATLTRLHKFAKTEWFEEKLSDPNPHIRAAVARFYGEKGDPRHATRISSLLFDDNHFVRSAAAETLGRFGDRTMIRPLMNVLTQQPPGGEPNVTPGGTNTTTMLGTGWDTLRDFIARELLHHKQEAIRILGDLHATEAVPLIIASGLRADYSGLRAAAAYALGQIGDRRAVEPLLETLRGFYTIAAPNAGTPTFADKPKFLLNARQEFEAVVRIRMNTVWALGRLGDAAATPVLRQALNDPNSLVRDAATEALAKIEKRSQRLAVNRP
jgi:HEAT repeat protein